MIPVQQEDIDIVLQREKILYAKIELLNKEFQIIDELQGYVIDGSVTIDANSDIRRTCNLSIVVNNSRLFVGETTRIWLDKYLRIYYGILHQRTQKIRWYPMGIFLLNDNKYEYSAVTNTLNLSCVDLMSKFTGIRNGQVQGYSIQIPQGSDIRGAMISTVEQLGGISNYLIEDPQKDVPYDLKFSTGCTVYEMISKLRDLYPGWETFFNLNGTFVCQKIPTCEDEPIILDDFILKQLVISDSLNNSFSDVKNVTDIWGKCLAADRYADQSTGSGTQYNIAFENFELQSIMTIGFKANHTNPASSNLKINNLAAYPIVNDNDEPIPAGTIQQGKTYVVKYRKEKFYFLGQFQIHAIAKEVSKEPTSSQAEQDKIKENCDNIFYVVNPESPYTIEKLGEIRQVLSSGEYENIYSDDLCIQRCEYENWKATRLNDSISLEVMGIPWLDVNQKIEYTSYSTKRAEQYIIKSINTSLKTGTQTIQAIKFYPLYPFIIEQ